MLLLEKVADKYEAFRVPGNFIITAVHGDCAAARDGGVSRLRPGYLALEKICSKIDLLCFAYRYGGSHGQRESGCYWRPSGIGEATPPVGQEMRCLLHAA
jgi:hypothetical protein